MTEKLILSLFPGIGLLDMAFEAEGFCVVRGPDILWGGDIHSFNPPPGVFAGVIGGPPCQRFSRLSHIVRLNNHREPDKYHLADNLIPEFVRCIICAKPDWWLMENVPDVPVDEWPAPEGYEVQSFTLNQRWVKGATSQNRLRRFWFGSNPGVDLRRNIEYAVLEPAEFDYAVLANGSNKRRPVKLAAGGKPKRLPKSGHGSVSIEEMARLQGLPDNFLSDSPFTAAGKRRVIGNGVPLPLGRAIARAIRQTFDQVTEMVAEDSPREAI